MHLILDDYLHVLSEGVLLLIYNAPDPGWLSSYIKWMIRKYLFQAANITWSPNGN